MQQVIQINANDNVVTCLTALKKGESFEAAGRKITVNMDIPVFHKVAVENIAKGGLCHKYGQIIGDALEEIKAGDHVHVHNIESTRGRGDKQNG